MESDNAAVCCLHSFSLTLVPRSTVIEKKTRKTGQKYEPPFYPTAATVAELPGLSSIYFRLAKIRTDIGDGNFLITSSSIPADLAI